MQHFLPGPSGSFESAVPDAVDANTGEPADVQTQMLDMIGAIIDELGMVWCAEHGQLEPTHESPNGGSTMGFPQPEPEQGYF